MNKLCKLLNFNNEDELFDSITNSFKNVVITTERLIETVKTEYKDKKIYRRGIYLGVGASYPFDINASLGLQVKSGYFFTLNKSVINKDNISFNFYSPIIKW